MATTEITTKNRRSLIALMELMGDDIHVIPSEKEGKYFFTCGDLKGYVAKPAAIKMLQEGDNDPSHYQFAEIKDDETGKWIPQIMRAGKEAVFSFNLHR